MKTLKSLIAGSLLLFGAPSAMAVLYEGSWHNTTFATTGDLLINLTLTETHVTGSLDLNGAVFGIGDPPAIPFDTALDADGTTKVHINDTDIGDLTVTIKSNGKIKLKITNTPGGFPSEVRIDGKFNLKLETFEGTYEVDSSGSLVAVGTLAAHVHKAAVIKAPRTVDVSGSSTTVDVRVLCSTDFTFRIKIDEGANADLSGPNPYEVFVNNLTAAETRLTLIVENDDGFKTRKVVKLQKSGPSIILGR